MSKVKRPSVNDLPVPSMDKDTLFDKEMENFLDNVLEDIDLNNKDIFPQFFPLEFKNEDIAKELLNEISIKQETVDAKYFCNHCQGKYVAPTNVALRKHISRNHKNEQKIFKENFRQTNFYYQCPSCSYKGPSPNALKQHRARKHRKNRGTKTQCGKTRNSLSSKKYFSK